MPRLVLVSASPRRRELLELAGIEAAVRPADVDESVQEGEAPRSVALRLAAEKARAARLESGEVALAADTVVALGPRVFGKPTDPPDAERMLAELAGRTHEVFTGWCVRDADREEVGVALTQVAFRPLTQADIARYVATGEPLDKAGGYGIQGRGGALVDRVEGSYPNVVGLPLAEVLVALASFGIRPDRGASR